ncbi:uncharacterized protein LOC101846572 [Aplysia californica]|uniref:Uncharacterized protein LOC101846572 n=1 Tax=Aplysia californica TaxID=6500 RepID=A0ABM0ZXY2_APLCA|nr:uncharacterized protein LOC101846572 [Aplysia californica]
MTEFLSIKEKVWVPNQRHSVDDPPIMQKQWQTADEEADRLLTTIAHGTDADLVHLLDSMAGDQVKAAVTHISRDGDTALHLAAVRERLGGLAAMLRNKVDANIRDGSGSR